MTTLLNKNRPPVFCPGCSHERVLQTLDQTLVEMGFNGHEVVIVTDIGCSGLFDTFFNAHAFHGLHGRALTYATGIKLARPDLKVIVTMGDGGLGIGGAHLLSTCRRNIDLTLLVLNNFNYGMTGGQCSSTTPQEAVVGSGFLNRLEKPVDVCQIAAAAGAPMVARASTYQKDLGVKLEKALDFDGFSILDIWGICPGRYTRHNRLTPKAIEADLARLPDLPEVQPQNIRVEYGKAYREEAAKTNRPKEPLSIGAICKPPQSGRQETVILGSAGQRIITAGELLCLAGASAGCHATQKNDYPITVMKGHSVSEIILADEKIEYTGIESPTAVIALAPEGINRRKKMLANLSPDTVVVKSSNVELHTYAATIIEVDFKAQKIRPQDWALAALAVLAKRQKILAMEMLIAALKMRFQEMVFNTAMEVLDKVSTLDE